MGQVRQAEASNEWLEQRAKEHRGNAQLKNIHGRYRETQNGLAGVYEELLDRRRESDIPVGVAIVTTYSGLQVDLAAPKPEDIRIEDVAHALGGIARFTGHTRRSRCGLYYTVAEHSVLGSLQTALWKPELALEFLLHDGPEAYLGDVSGPLKSIVGPVYAELERRWAAAFAERYRLRTDDEAAVVVKSVDERMLRCEGVALMGWSAKEWGVAGVKRDEELVQALDARYANEGLIDGESMIDPEALFLAQFGRLIDQRQLLMPAGR